MTVEKINLLILVTIVIAFKAIALPINTDRELTSENQNSLLIIDKKSRFDL